MRAAVAIHDRASRIAAHAAAAKFMVGGRTGRHDAGGEIRRVHHVGSWCPDEVDRKLLRTIIDKFNGGPVGVNSLAAAIHEEKDAIEDIYEPFLIQAGFLDRTPRGRVATPRAYEYFGLTPPKKDSRLW